MKRLLISVVLAVALLIVPASGALAATSADVTVTATPSYVEIASTGTVTWNMGGVGAVITKNTTYYANSDNHSIAADATVVAGDCLFEITNASTVPIDISVDFDDFKVSESPVMTNSEDGTNLLATFGAWSYYEGMLLYNTNKEVAKKSGSLVLYDEMPTATTTLKWGVEVLSQAGDFASGDEMTATVTISAVAD